LLCSRLGRLGKFDQRTVNHVPGIISLPLPGQKFGPGADTFVTDDTIGPFPIDDEVRICLIGTSGTEEESVCANLPAQNNSWFIRWAVPDSTTGWTISARGNFTTGAQMNLVARRRHANGTVVWQTSVPVVLDDQEFAWQYGFWTLFRGSSQTGGFLQSDRDLLFEIRNAVIRSWQIA